MAVSAEILPGSLPAAGCTVTLRLINPDGTPLLSSELCYGPSARYGPVTFTVSGMASLQVTSDEAAGSGTVKLFTDDDRRGTFPGGNPSDVTTKLVVPGQEARYTFAGQAGQTTVVGVSGGTFPPDCGDLFGLIGPDNETVSSYSVCHPANATLAPVQLAETGTYTVFLKLAGAATGSAVLSVDKSPTP